MKKSIGNASITGYANVAKYSEPEARRLEMVADPGFERPEAAMKWLIIGTH
jgi:hypothetical protein